MRQPLQTLCGHRYGQRCDADADTDFSVFFAKITFEQARMGVHPHTMVMLIFRTSILLPEVA